MEGRSILHNIQLCQDIMKMYKSRQAQKCCLMKIDIQKAYDIVSWEFIEDMMLALKFPRTFVDMVMTFVNNPTFTLMINEASTGFFI